MNQTARYLIAYVRVANHPDLMINSFTRVIHNRLIMRLNAVTTIAAILNYEGIGDVMEKQSICILMRRKKFSNILWEILFIFFLIPL